MFSLQDKGLKFNSAADLQEFLPIEDDVKEIRLSGNTFGVDASIELAKHLTNKESLENAQMADIFTGRLREEIPAALEALLPALQTCRNLRTVNLCDNAFGPTAASPLEAFFTAHEPLRHLYLQNNGMGPEAGSRMATALSRNKAALETIVCGRNRLENGSSKAWVECFTAHQTLKTLKMPQNGIRPEGVEVLLRGLKNCKALETLDFQDNTFTEKGTNALCDALPSWPDLKELAVGDCLLGKRTIALFEGLQKKTNVNIRILRLQYNDINSAGLKALHKAIELGLPNLEILELNGNKFAEDDESLDAIRSIFEERGVGELDELDDLESDEEETDASEVDEDEEEDKPEQKEISLDAMIEKNLAEAISGLST